MFGGVLGQVKKELQIKKQAKKFDTAETFNSDYMEVKSSLTAGFKEGQIDIWEEIKELKYVRRKMEEI